ncbi:MAG: hypothetical protein CVU31_00160 [Betaproteobacteria bacterium HGW-Betaproteobacteria-4]|jgi:mono/diheme cytochrome c family protein|nr:MAG: hypothetical protein CVU31_00160 [Betaproteobacteria bacterium HGW-Betaproteobacteria-4]
MRVHLPLVLAVLGLSGLFNPVRAQDAPGAAAATAAPGVAAPGGDVNALRGKRAFQRYCVVCHGARGEGGIGPTLQGVATRLGEDAIRHQVHEPRGTMPRLYPSPVDEPMLGDLVAFLSQLK